jgi:hypothetical protein
MAVDDVQEIEALAELGIAAGAARQPPRQQQQTRSRAAGLAQRHAFNDNRLTCTHVCALPAAADVKKAKEGGFHTVQSLIMNPRKVGVRPVLGPCWLVADWLAGKDGCACSPLPICRMPQQQDAACRGRVWAHFINLTLALHAHDVYACSGCMLSRACQKPRQTSWSKLPRS